jgi:hypothetical protein
LNGLLVGIAFVAAPESPNRVPKHNAESNDSELPPAPDDTSIWTASSDALVSHHSDPSPSPPAEEQQQEQQQQQQQKEEERAAAQVDPPGNAPTLVIPTLSIREQRLQTLECQRSLLQQLEQVCA